MNPEVKAAIDRFAEKTIIVIGDVMLDRFWWGAVERISPEAPVPIVDLKSSSDIVGGAANVAANACSLGAKVAVLGVIGDDDDGDALTKALTLMGIDGSGLVRIPGRPTTVKTRIIASHQQLVRVDKESKELIPPSAASELLEKFTSLLPQADVVVISDYAKGVLSADLLSRIIGLARNYNVSTLVDPKGRDYSKYRGATLITPNRKEAFEACSDEIFTTVEDAGKLLLEKHSLEAVLITQGENGMTLFETGEAPRNMRARARHVYDVTGAGDTVIATLAAGIGAGLSLGDAAEVANIAAGFVVEEVGTTVITLEKLKSEVDVFS